MEIVMNVEELCKTSGFEFGKKYGRLRTLFELPEVDATLMAGVGSHVSAFQEACPEAFINDIDDFVLWIRDEVLKVVAGLLCVGIDRV